MRQCYQDILDRIAEKPKWFDEEAVPRYEPFTPRAVANIYCDEAVLFLVTCQACGHPFPVAMTRARSWEAVASPGSRDLADRISDKSLHYGDPPNIACCPAGPTMNSEPRRVLEYWRKERDREKPNWLEWARDPALEVNIEPEWVTDDE